MNQPNPQPQRRDDWIQQRATDRARQLRLSAQEIADRSGIPVQHVQLYFAGSNSMSSARLAYLLKALRLDIQPERP